MSLWRSRRNRQRLVEIGERIPEIPLAEIDLASLQKRFQIARVLLERFVQDGFRFRLAVGGDIARHQGATHDAVARIGRKHLLQVGNRLRTPILAYQKNDIGERSFGFGRFGGPFERLLRERLLAGFELHRPQ